MVFHTPSFACANSCSISSALHKARGKELADVVVSMLRFIDDGVRVAGHAFFKYALSFGQEWRAKSRERSTMETIGKSLQQLLEILGCLDIGALKAHNIVNVAVRSGTQLRLTVAFVME